MAVGRRGEKHEGGGRRNLHASRAALTKLRTSAAGQLALPAMSLQLQHSAQETQRESKSAGVAHVTHRVCQSLLEVRRAAAAQIDCKPSLVDAPRDDKKRVRSALQQKLCRVALPHLRGEVQGSHARLVRHIHIRPSVKQLQRRLHVAVASGVVQRSATVALRGTLVT